MSKKVKYKIYIAVVLGAFMYVLATEVVDRAAEVLQYSATLRERQLKLMTPEDLAKRKAELISQKRFLAASFAKGNHKFDQSEAGVVEFLTLYARQKSVQLESIVPAETKQSGELKGLDLKMSFLSTYHQAGQFINAIETGEMPVRVTSLDISSDQAPSRKLHILLEGRSFMLPKKSLQ